MKRPIISIFALAVSLTAAGPLLAYQEIPPNDSPRNLFEWSAVAPIVVAVESLGEDGRYLELRVDETIRGGLPMGVTIDVDLRFANRERDRMLYPKALRLDAGVDYVVLLEPVKSRKDDKVDHFRIVRGVLGARELPLEGREPYLDALRRFVAIQETRSDSRIWQAFSEMLGETNPLLIETALAQFSKFRRGEPELLVDIRPLLDHPRPDLREGASRLIGQILIRFRDRDSIPDEEPLRIELVSRARRDDAVGVRIAATEALAGFPVETVGLVLDEIAESDPEQSVRYVAELIRLEFRRRDDSASAGTSRPD